MLGVIIEFTNLDTQFKIIILNKKFRQVIQSSNIFCDFLRKIKESSKVTLTNQIFNDKILLSPYIIRLRDDLEQKYTSHQVEDFLTEMLKILLNRLTKKDSLNLAGNNLGRNPEIIKMIIDFLKRNQLLLT
jgi:hypothetical protein